MKLQSALLSSNGQRISIAQYDIQRVSNVHESLLASLEKLEGNTSLVYHYYKGVADTYKELLEYFNNNNDNDNDNKEARPDTSLYPGGRDFDPDRDAFG